MKQDDIILDKILTTIEDLVSFRTVDGANDVFEKTVRYCEDFFAGSDVIIKKYNYSGYPALVILSEETKTPTFMLQGHLDVVDGSDSQFHPQQNGEYLHGRGTVDMKGFDALAMHLVKHLRKSHPEISIGLMLTFDEEVGGSNGTACLVEENYLPGILINGDGGYNYAVTYAEKGILKFELKVESISGRHTYPWNGQNAFDLLIEDYFQIISLFKDQGIATDSDNWYTTYSSYDICVKNEPLFAPHHAEMKVNIYFADDISSDTLFQDIKNLLKHAAIEKLWGSERVYLEPGNKQIIQMQQKLQHHFNQPIVVHSENGSSDARFFANKGIPIVIIKMVGEGHHTPEEKLHIPSILPMYNSVKDFIIENVLNYVQSKEVVSNG
ncbi:MAG: M20/M25/M40 family metallo-hydrolase [Melioribacteraceae bacterium]|nr:M20/M25/M40 family metallo-hydrolase [Melioribacteraceae bacterium]MCF8354080.1 M20/M25/M40 family metallo-hydrolase [Melioribacteraceae bacterium]MCF8393752.1 M20/M25/M40 family metallo-hydrolase [Melioribacteraceae bacterium]MCF8419496.1 M20/M25/M40 family metallo-hydrolase [Melioribacteraceae bacterium]